MKLSLQGASSMDGPPRGAAAGGCPRGPGPGFRRALPVRWASDRILSSQLWAPQSSELAPCAASKRFISLRQRPFLLFLIPRLSVFCLFCQFIQKPETQNHRFFPGSPSISLCPPAPGESCRFFFMKSLFFWLPLQDGLIFSKLHASHVLKFPSKYS